MFMKFEKIIMIDNGVYYMWFCFKYCDSFC